MNADTDKDIAAQADAEVKPEVKPEVEAEVKAEIEAKAEAGPDAKHEAGAEAEVKPEAEAESEVQPDAEAELAPPRRRAPHTLRGSVASAAADKTITVLIERKIKHPLYKKYIRRSTRVHAHDENNECRRGDTVLIEACRPLSKLKCWRLVEVVGKVA